MNASQVVEALRVKFPPQEFAFFTEVANGTGSHARRHLDVVVVGLWPSRGLDRHGFEVKVSKSDLKRELDQPEKADEIAKYLDYFSIAAPKDLANPADLPSAWGLIEVGPRGCTWTKQPAKLEPKENSRPFFAALCRAAAKESDRLRVGSIPRAEYDRLVGEELAKAVDDRLAVMVEQAVRKERIAAERSSVMLERIEAALAEIARVTSVPITELRFDGGWKWSQITRAFACAAHLTSDRGFDVEKLAERMDGAAKVVREAANLFRKETDDEHPTPDRAL